jgi:hypothetical protein
MSKPRETALELHLKRSFLAYDARTGDVLHTHEFLSESDPCGGAEDAWDAEAVRQMAARDFEARDVRVIPVPRGMGGREESSYRVDLKTGTLVEVERPRQRFRDFVREPAQKRR